MTRCSVQTNNINLSLWADEMVAVQIVLISLQTIPQRVVGEAFSVRAAWCLTDGQSVHRIDRKRHDMLRLECIATRSLDRRFLRISGYDVSTWGVLQQSFQHLADGQLERADLGNLPGVEAVDSCRLVARVGKRNQGVVLSDGSNVFEWILTPAGWDNNVGLIAPFCEQDWTQGYQWLDSPSDISVLASPSGQF